MTTSAPLYTVGIATRSRAAKLERTLAALSVLAPETPPFEVVVVVDGDDPDTRAVLASERPFAIRTFSQQRGGPAPTRNRAAQEARGELVLFINDDTRPHPGCLLAHARAREEHGSSMTAGHVAWEPETETTPYMKWLAPGGHQFNFQRLRANAVMPWDAIWGAHICVPRAWVLDEPFDPDFPFTCLEDGEWAYRQYRRGRRAIYVADAVVYHDHRYEGPASYRGRARSFGSAARHVVRKHPELAWRLLARPALATAARLASLVLPTHWRRAMIWDLDFRLNCVRGMVAPRPDIA